MPTVVPKSVMLGCDPEVFAVHGKTVLPAYKFLPDKNAPIEMGHKIRTYHDEPFSQVFWDGVQAEMTVRPENCIAWLCDSVQLGLATTLKAARKITPDARLTLSNVITFPEAERKVAKREHVELGCSPSMNAYGMGGERPGDGRKLPVRFAGGHIHLSSLRAQQEPDKAAKFLDATLGVWSVGAAAGIDNPIRRKFYGLAGEFRPTNYGIEYRVLSNFWLCHPGIFHLTFELARLFTNVFDSCAEDKWISDEMEVVRVINKYDVLGARKILERNKPTLASWLMNCIGFNPDKVFRVAEQSVMSTVPNVRDIEGNWMLDGKWGMHSNQNSSGWVATSNSLLPVETAVAG